MTTGRSIDGVLVQWGERLFYPANHRAKTAQSRTAASVRQRAIAIRARIQATVVRRAPQVMVKVTGGGRGMAAIVAHLRYISRAARLPFEDDRGAVREGKQALRDLAEQWRYGGSFIGDTSPRREAFNIMLSMPSGTDPLSIQRAAREFAETELADHRYVMVLHDHQANPHVHLSVRAESRFGTRLNPRKADLQRWRETFAEKLRGWGVDAEATRQATRGQLRNFESLWRVKAAEQGRLNTPGDPSKSGPRSERSRKQAIVAWAHIAHSLAGSEDAEDRALAHRVDRYARSTPFAVEYTRRLDKRQERTQQIIDRKPARDVRPAPRDMDIQR